MDAKELKEKIDSVVVKYNEKPKDGEYGVISLMNEINDLIEENGAFHTLKGAENPLIYEMFYLNSILKWNKTYKHKVSLLESYFNEEIYKVSMNQNIFNSLPKSKRENVNKLIFKSYEPTDKSMKDLMSVFCSTDDLRPALMGVNYNELGVVSTDAYKMLFLNKKDNKYKKDVTKCITDYCVKSHKKLGVTESQFPNWKLITPTKDYANLDFVFDVDALFSYITICLNFGLFYKGGADQNNPIVTFDFLKNNNSDDSIFSFNIEYLLDCLKGLIKLGISEARINYSSPSKAIVFTDAKVIEKDFLNQNFILLMPVMTGDMFKNYYFDFKTNSVVYGEKKYEFPIGIEEKVQKEINTFEYKDVKINITLDELSNYPKIKDKLSKLSDSKLKKSISGGCSTNYNIGSNTYSCKYNIIEVENETNVEKKESISTIYNIEILNGTFGNQDISHDVERKVLEYFGRIKKVEEVKVENKKETPAESKPNNDVFDVKKLDLNNPISSRVYYRGVDNDIDKILKSNYKSIFDFDKKGIEWVYKNTRYNVKDDDLILELKEALAERNRGAVDIMRINNELPRIESKYGKDVNLAKRMYKEAKDFYESKLRNEKSIRANEVFIDYLISRLKETKKEETPVESKSDLDFLNEMLKTSKNLLDLISDTGNKEDVDYLKKKIETTKNLISLLSIDEKKKFENGGLIAPNGKPSNLTPEQYKLVRTPEFKEWFGDWENDPANASKVIDENGEPLPVYHGTDKKFNVFNKSIETDYNGKYEFLVENVDVDSEKFKEIEKHNEERGSMSAYEDFWFSNINWMEGSKHILLCFLNCRTLYVDENGQGGQGVYNPSYGDGLKITNADGQNGVDYYVVNNSNQIKLADGTNTTFDGNNPDIRFDDGGISYVPNVRIRSSRFSIPNVRGGWTKEKIIKYFKERSSDTITTYRLTKYISEFDNWQQFKDHIYYHGSKSGIDGGLKPSITMSERDAERNGGGGYGERYFGISLTKNKKTAESFSGMSSRVIIYPVILKRDAKVIERTDLQDASDIEDIIVDLYEKGIDAVWIGGGEEELVVVNPYSVLLYDKGNEIHQIYGGFKSVPLTDDKIKEIYDNSLLLWNEYSEELKTKLTKDEKNDFFYSLPKIQFEDGGKARPFTDDGNKYVVFNEFRNYNPYKIAVNDVNNADYITLWKTDMDTGKDKKVGALKLNETSYNYRDGFLSVSEIYIDRGSKGLGLGLEMYKVALKYSSDKIKGIKSYLPNRTNKKQIPKIYKKLNSVEDGDYEFIYKEHNPNIKFNDGGSVLLAPNGKPSNLTPEQYKLVRTPEFKEWFGDWENDPANASKVIDKETKEPLVVYHGNRSEIKFAFSVFNIEKDGGVFFTSDEGTAKWFSSGYSYSPQLLFEDVKIPMTISEDSDLKDLEKYYKENLDSTAFIKIYTIRNGDGEVIYRLNTDNDSSSSPLGGTKELAQKKLYKKIVDAVNWQKKTEARGFLYKVFLNIKNPYEIDANGKGFWETPFEGVESNATSIMYEIKQRGKNDALIIRNTIEGTDTHYQKKSDTFIVFQPNQIKLADGTNTTFDGSNPDIRFDDGGEATNYTEFFDRLKIEDGTKYIGQKFGDVFPFLKGSFSTPFKYKLRVKQYNDYLKRLSEDNYTTKAMKQRDLNKIEYNKGRINKVKYLSEFVCDSTGTIIDFKHNTDVRFADGGSISTSRFYATKEVSNWNDIPSTWKNINKVNKVNLKLDPNDDKFNSVFKKFLSTDELRPVMMGYNVDENGITCTNAHILAVIPTKENLQKGIFLNGKEIDGKYPNYNAVIPKDNFKSISRVDSYKLLQYSNVALNYSDKSYFGCNFNTEIGVMTFNLKLLITILETSLKLGYEELYFKFKESNNGVVISNVEEPILGKDIIFLLFPMLNRQSEFKGTQNLDYDLELSCYFDFTKNEIINKDNSIVDFEMNYGENPVFTKEIISLLKLNIDTKTHLPILDNFLVEDKKIRLVNFDNNTTLLIKDVDAPTGLYYIQNNVAVYSDISIDDYPKNSPFFNDKPKPINKVNISSEYFKWILDVLNSSKGDDDLRPVMTGLNISYDGSELLFASTNGHSLGVIKANKNVSFENKNNFNEIINFGKISDLINFKKDSNVVIEFYQEGNFKIVTDGFDIVSKVIDGRYPTYSAVIPKNSSNKLTINNKKLIDALSSKEAQSFIKKAPSSKGAIYSSLKILGEEKDGQLVISLVLTELNYRSDKEEKVLDSKVIYTDDLVLDNDANIETTDSCILLMPMERREPHLFYFQFSLFNKFIKPVNTQSFDLLFNNGGGKPYVVNSNNFDYTQKASKKEVSKPKEVKAVSLKPKKQIPAESNSDLEYLKGLLSTSKDLLDLIFITGNKEDVDYLKEKIKVTKTLISLIE